MISPGDDTLAAALELAAELQQRPGEVDQRVGEWMQDHLRRGAGAGPLSEALGLDHRAEIVRSRRDALLQAMASTFWPDLPEDAAAKRIASALAEYQERQWPRERIEPRCPHRTDSRSGMLWQILNAWPVGLGAKQIARILRSSG